LIKHNVRRGLRGATDIIAISPYVMEEYGSMTRARWHRVDNPIPEAFFELPNREHPRRILFPGSVDERKNALDLLRALARVRESHPDVELHIAGRENSAAYGRALRDYVADHGLTENVVFRGLLTHEQMLEAYSEAAIVALTSRQETQPMAVIEGMASGKAVVATRVGGVTDLIGDGGSGFVVELGDIDGLAQRIESLLQDEQLRHRIGAAAREAASARFRIGTVAAKYVEIYRDMVGGAVP
jgi:glycosyltransferase involved in cell wall biosynthesis